jgi:hypothetical protein
MVSYDFIAFSNTLYPVESVLRTVFRSHIFHGPCVLSIRSYIASFFGDLQQRVAVFRVLS